MLYTVLVPTPASLRHVTGSSWCESELPTSTEDVFQVWSDESSPAEGRAGWRGWRRRWQTAAKARTGSLRAAPALSAPLAVSFIPTNTRGGRCCVYDPFYRWGNRSMSVAAGSNCTAAGGL